MSENRNSQHALLTAAAGVTLAAGAFAYMRSGSRQQLDTLEDADRLQWLCNEDAPSIAARNLLALDSGKVRTLRLQHDEKASLKRVPSFHRLKGLRELNVQHATLDTALLSSLAACSQLTSLRAAHAGLEELPASIGQLAALQQLDFTGNGLQQLPACIGTLSALTRLALGRNRLAALPPQISGLVSLQDLDVSRNALTALPPEIGACTRLRFLNAMANRLESVPPELGCLCSLYRLGLKSNRLRSLPDNLGQLTSLVELFLTDNQLTELPGTIGACTSLVKLQASFNELTTLPECLAALPRLELCRVACCGISTLPPGLAAAPALAWLSLGGNPVCAPPPPHRVEIASVTIDELALGAPLGDGASGDVFASTFQGQEVAVKVFKGEASPDGRASDEIDVTCAVAHRSLIRAIGLVQQPHALVVHKVDGAPLAVKPDLTSLLRCRWVPGLQLPAGFVLRVASDVAAALAELHRLHICHGDVYAHNVLADAAGSAVLCDYGASFFYQPDTLPFEAQEVRAFGLLLADMAARVVAAAGGAGGIAGTVGTDSNGSSAEGGAAAAPAGIWQGLGGWLRSWANGQQPPTPAQTDVPETVDAGVAGESAAGGGSASSSDFARLLAELAGRCTHPALHSRPSFPDICQQLQRLSHD